MITLTVVITFSFALLGYTTAVDTANGERVGGCPADVTASNSYYDACTVDSDCTGNPLHKCCADQYGTKVCVNPIPACRDGFRIDEYDLLDGTCFELAGEHCIDQGCEDGPPGPGGWKAACCRGYAFEWTGSRRPTCGNFVEPARDSEGEYFWCNSRSVRSCPQNTGCITDPSGYQICCPSPPQPATSQPTVATPAPPNGQVCTPGDYYTLPNDPCQSCLCGSDGQPTDLCDEMMCDIPECPDGHLPQNIPGTCCGFECVPSSERVCTPGEQYTMPDDPCRDCLCGNDGQPTDNCREKRCSLFNCPRGQRAKHIPGTCCGFECETAPVSSEPVCTPGEVYTFPDDPCKRCWCGDDGQPLDICAETQCDVPTYECPDGQHMVPTPGVCCGFECAPESTETVCTPGEHYTPPDRPCSICRCGEDGQPTDNCAEPDCFMPDCPEGQQAEPIPDSCCEYECRVPAYLPVCTPGENYFLPDNPCMSCKCGEDGHPTDDCDEIYCFPSTCPLGQYPEPIEGTCCGSRCVDIPSQVCTPGEHYTLPDDPCRTCLCGEDGRPTTQCREDRCDAPQCPEGQRVKLIPGTCCGFECELSSDRVCAPGELYTLPNDPCMDCRCGHDGQPTKECSQKYCSPIHCPPGHININIPGSCCGQECVPSEEHSPGVCTPGEMYTSPEDPCRDCLCGHDGRPTERCRVILCSPIRCPPGQIVLNSPGTCCGQECVPEPAPIESQRVCTPGEMYTSPEDPCRSCLCGDDSLPTERCREITCSPIYCPPGQTTRNIPGTCCGQECVPEPVPIQRVCTPGDYHEMPDNPCMTCKCGPDGQPTDRCYTVQCGARACHEGQQAVDIPGTCCEYECVWDRVCTPGERYALPGEACKDCICGPDGRPTEDCIDRVCPPISCGPGETAKLVPGGCCSQICEANVANEIHSPTPSQRACTPGKFYTLPENPCKRCLCGDDGRPTFYCDERYCRPQRCPPGKHPEPVPGKCCRSRCVDLPNQVCTPGEQYSPPDRPCETCFCGEDGQPTEHCAGIDCFTRDCPVGQQAQPIPGTCCEYECVDLPSQVCTPGEEYTLPDRPCKRCFCGEDGQPTEHCAVTDCSTSDCPVGQQAQPIPGTCCEYECVYLPVPGV